MSLPLPPDQVSLSEEEGRMMDEEQVKELSGLIAEEEEEDRRYVLEDA